MTSAGRFMQWLRDAHAMEIEGERVLGRMADRLGNHHPALQARIEQHIAETRNHARLIEGCIAAHGGATDALPPRWLAAMVGALTGIFGNGEVMQAVLAGYTLESMEIGAYRILIAAAEELGNCQTAMVCRQILLEEEAMAEWLADEIDPLTKELVDREQDAVAGARR